jgi:hypothetical protein
MQPRFLALFALLFAALAVAQDADTKKFLLLSEDRRQLQSKFSTCQGKIYPNPALAPADAQLQMEQINKEILNLSAAVLDFEGDRYRSLSSDFGNSGASVRNMLQKLEAQLAKLRSMKVPVAGPFKRPDLDASQQTLNAMRGALELDEELTKMLKQYRRR